MARLKRALGGFVLIAAGALAVDYVLVSTKEGRVSSAVRRCGGRMASIPIWPLGAEYVISFPHALTSEQLDSLAELNSLRGSVALYFNDELSEEQIRDAARKLPRCRLHRGNGGSTRPR